MVTAKFASAITLNVLTRAEALNERPLLDETTRGIRFSLSQLMQRSV